MADVKVASCYKSIQAADSLTFVGDTSGQCFSLAYAVPYLLKSCKFNLMKYGSPTGFVGARLYACTGTCGSTGKPTGAPLATSTNTLNVALFSTIKYGPKTFVFDGTFEMQPGTFYVIVVYAVSGFFDGMNYVMVSQDNITNPCSGNQSHLTEGLIWVAYADIDVEFEVWGELVVIVKVRAGLNIPQVLPIILDDN